MSFITNIGLGKFCGTLGALAGGYFTYDTILLSRYRGNISDKKIESLKPTEICTILKDYAGKGTSLNEKRWKSMQQEGKYENSFPKYKELLNQQCRNAAERNDQISLKNAVTCKMEFEQHVKFLHTMDCQDAGILPGTPADVKRCEELKKRLEKIYKAGESSAAFSEMWCSSESI
jgi:hypothetical protein